MAPTQTQTLILWALLAKPGGASFQKDIKPDVTKPDREALVGAGLITSEKRGRPGFWLEITDRGWAWAADHLDADLPKRSLAGSAILRAWLKRLKAFMQARGLALADILGPQQSPEPPPLDGPALRQRIRAAYLDIAGNRLNTRVLLSDLRGKLRDIDRATLDDALTRMHLEQGSTLSGLDNPREITPAIRDGGLAFKGEPMFVLWITR